MNNADKCRLFPSNSFKEMWDFYQEIDQVTNIKRYIEKIDYLPIIEKYTNTFNYLLKLQQDNLLVVTSSYNNISYTEVKNIMKLFFEIEKVIQKINYKYLYADFNELDEIEGNIDSFIFKGYSYDYIVQTVLNCLISISQKRNYGVGVLAQVLKGCMEKEYKTIDIKENKYYGSLSNLSIDQIRNIIYVLISIGYIEQNRTYMPKIKISLKVKTLKRVDDNMIKMLKQALSNEIQTLL